MKKNNGNTNVIVLVVILVLVGLWLFGTGRVRMASLGRGLSTPVVTNFIECERYGYQVSGSYPRACRTANGQVFIESSAVPAYNNSNGIYTAASYTNPNPMPAYYTYSAPVMPRAYVTYPIAKSSSSSIYNSAPRAYTSSSSSSSYYISNQPVEYDTYVYTSDTGGSTGGCYVSGCSREICSDQPGVSSSCEYRPEYACYQSARCERQVSGQCGWTPTSELFSCMRNHYGY